LKREGIEEEEEEEEEEESSVASESIDVDCVSTEH
jgi:hypothetical protein